MDKQKQKEIRRKYEETNSFLLLCTGQCHDMRLSHKKIGSKGREGLFQSLCAVQMCAVSQRSAGEFWFAWYTASSLLKYMPFFIYLQTFLSNIFLVPLSLLLSEDYVYSIISIARERIQYQQAEDNLLYSSTTIYFDSELSVTMLSWLFQPSTYLSQ